VVVVISHWSENTRAVAGEGVAFNPGHCERPLIQVIAVANTI
jgi:hypothetical protein